MGGARSRRNRRTPPSPGEVDDALGRLRGVLASRPVLVLHDAELPSVTAIVAGAPILGSWWGHPKGALIFEVLARIEDEAAWPKLVREQVTLVQRELWPALVSACSGEEPWQLKGLPREGRELLARVQENGSARTDHLRENLDARLVGRAVDQLERRLLVMSTQVHTASGKHARELSTWQRWRQRSGLAAMPLPAPNAARAQIEASVADLDRGGGPLLPWMAASSTL